MFTCFIVDSEFGNSVSKGIFPESLKVAKVILCKKGDEDEALCSNYSPISFLSSHEIVEKLIAGKRKSIDFLSKNDFL